MNYIDYSVEIEIKNLVLVNQSSKEHEYIVEWVDIENKLLCVRAIKRNDKVRIPFNRVNNIDIGLLEEYYPECLF